MQTESPGSARRRTAIVFLAVFGIAAGFALYTRHAWEDYFITYRCSKNLATGQGLVFTPGERVHAFTSPLNTLIPAALSYATGNQSDRLVLWLFRLISCTALAAGAVLLYRIAQSRSFGRLATFTWIGLFATVPGIVDFSINGQETGLMMFFLAMTLHGLMVPGRRVGVQMGIAWAGLMWTRPDSFVYIAAIAGAFLFFNAGSTAHSTRLALVKTYLVAGAVTTVLYLPWVVWAWTYFGSPVPNTVVAKGLDHSFLLTSLWDRTCSFVMLIFTANHDLLDSLFAPPYSGFPEWPTWMFPGCRWLAWIAALYWILPFGRRETRALSLATLLGIWYLSAVLRLAFPWYLPNVAILAVCVLGQIVQQLSDLIRLMAETRPKWETLARIRDWTVWRCRLAHFVLALAIPAFTASVLVMCGFQLRIQQREVELGNRMQIGLWLHENAKSANESVFLEPLGYIGYFSQLKMYDWPGLCSREVLEVRKSVSSRMAKMIPALRPDWLVLRPCEVAEISAEGPGILGQQYVPVKVFDASERLKAYSWIPGRRYPMFDQTYTVFRRVQPKAEPPHVASGSAKRG